MLALPLSPDQVDGDQDQKPAPHHERIVLNAARLKSLQAAVSRLQRAGNAVDETVDDILIEDRREPRERERNLREEPVDPDPVDHAGIEVPQQSAAPLADAFHEA